MNHHPKDVWAAQALALDRPELTVMARSMIAARRALHGPLPTEILHDSALDLLLNLFISAPDGAMQQHALIGRTTASHSVALRWIDVLVSHGLVDRAGSTVMLTPAGDAAVVATLRSVAESQWHLDDVR